MLMRSTFIGLWILGWVSVTLLVASVSKDFRKENNYKTQDVQLTNPGVKKLEVTTLNPSDEYRHRTFFRGELFDGVDEDTATVRNVTINIFKATTDSFRVTMLKVARGRTRSFADTAAALINYNVKQQDSVLLLDEGIAINKTDKFRNQQVVINIYVPVGKQIRIDKSVERWGGVHVSGFGIRDNDWGFQTDNAMGGWDTDVDYVMKADGLYTLFGEPAGDANNHRRKVRTTIVKDGVTIEDRYEDEDNNYRYDEKDKPAVKTSIDSLKEKLKIEEKKTRDSLEKTIEKSKQELEKLKKTTEGTTAMNTPVLQGYNPLLLMNL